jgi:PAS domain S-box-containing protein
MVESKGRRRSREPEPGELAEAYAAQGRTLAAALDTVADPVWATDLGGRCLYANAAAAAALGRPRARLAGLEIAPLLARNGAAPLGEALAEVLATGAPRTAEARLGSRKAAYDYECVVTADRDEEGRVVGALVVARNITLRRQADERLRRERDRAEQLIASLPGVFFLLSEQGRLVRWNTRLCGVSGYAADEVAGMKAIDFCASEERDRASAAFTKAFGTGSAEVELTMLTRDGRRLPFLFTATRIVYDGQRCVLGSGLDISDRQRIEAQLAQAQRIESIGRLAGGIAHDFNNLLVTIQAMTEVLEMDTPEGDARREDLAVVKEAVKRGADLTRQMLAFSRRQMLTPRLVDVNALVANLDAMFRRLIGEDIELVTLLGEDVGTVLVDPSQLESVLANLVVNARDAMPRGGTLSITSSRNAVDATNALVAVQQPGDYVRLTVSDNGPGMDEEVQRHLFEPFYTTKPIGEGSGLGLASVYGVVKQSGGFITIQSAPGRGTMFTIDLPRQGALAVPAAAAPTSAAPELRGTETVLLAEDNGAVRQAVGRMLKGFGYTVLSARNGETALRMAQKYEGPIHLLLSDVVMPGMSAEELRAGFAALRPESRILFMSGYTDDAVVREGIHHGRIPFIQKPFTATDIAVRIRTVLGG